MFNFSKKIGIASCSYRVYGVVLSAILLGCLAGVTNASLQAKLNSFKNFTANFTQVLSAHGQTQKTAGHVWLQKPSQFRWQVQKPSKQLYVSNGKQIWDYEANLMQVIVRPVDKMLSQTPLLLLSGQVKNLQQLFIIKSLGSDTYQLTPKKQGDLIKSITLKFKGNALLQLSFENVTGQLSIIRFHDVRINQSINSNQFAFTAPKGVDVIGGKSY